MPAYLNLGATSSPDLFDVALQLICEGKAVSFPGFSLTIWNGEVRMDVDYPHDGSDDILASMYVERAMRDFSGLLVNFPAYAAAFAGKPHRVFLTHAYGMGEVEVGEYIDGRTNWRSI